MASAGKKSFDAGTVRAKLQIAMKIKPLMLALTSVAVLLCGPAAPPISAQLAVPPPMPVYQPLTGEQLDQLLGPIALYPDPLVAIILPASTLPTQVVMADRYATSGGDPNSIDQQPWDPSVQALARYPSVLSYMDNNLGWTTELGQAFLNQQQDVMDSIQRLRTSAENYGNLASTPQQQVVNDDGDIEILPTEPNVIYVPVYQPNYVYFQSGYGLGFGVGFSIGPWLDFDFDWHEHHLFSWDRDRPRPANWWQERPDQRTAWTARQKPEDHVWRPEDHRNVDTSHNGDRGWYNQPVRTPEARPATQPHPDERRPAAEPRPAPVREPARVATPQPAQPNRPVNSGAFIGSGSARDARDFSNRGQQSIQTISRPAPAPVHTAPAPSNQGGGFHGGGPQPRH